MASFRKMLIAPAGRPKALASQFVPEKACCSCEGVALDKFVSCPLSRSMMNTRGAAPTLTTENAGIVVPLMGSLPLMLNDNTLAAAVLPGYPAS